MTKFDLKPYELETTHGVLHAGDEGARYLHALAREAGPRAASELPEILEFSHL